VSYTPSSETSSSVPTKALSVPRPRRRMGSHSSSAGRYPEFIREFVWAAMLLMAPVTGSLSALVVAEHWNATNPTEQVVNLHPIPNATNYPVPHVQPSKRPIGQNPTCWLDRNPAWPDC